MVKGMDQIKNTLSCDAYNERRFTTSEARLTEVTMPSSKVTVEHNLGKDEALSRIKGVLSSSDISDLQKNWTDDGGSFSGKIMGMDVSGSVEVSDTNAEIDVSYPMAARPFKGKIESTLKEKAESVLAA